MCVAAPASCLASSSQVCQWVFGQEFPAPDSPLGQQVLAVGTAVVGLAVFAMVLALVEQVVLEALEANVKRGSKVFEAGHVSDAGAPADWGMLNRRQLCSHAWPRTSHTLGPSTERAGRGYALHPVGPFTGWSDASKAASSVLHPVPIRCLQQFALSRGILVLSLMGRSTPCCPA